MGESKHIGIITYPRIEDGKGRFLQAYALSCAITSLGYDNEIINYLPREWTTNRSLLDKLRRYVKKPDFLGLLQDVKSRKSNRYFRKSNSTSKAKYVEFIKENLKYDLNSHISADELQNLKFDAWICGSDQIWNPHFSVGRDEAYYLQFAPKNKRIAYAASMGTLDIDSPQLEMQKHWIQEIPYVSVREYGTCELLKRILGSDVEHVCDPTFLMPLDWWHSLAGRRIIKDKYLLLFLFDNNPLPRQVAETIAKDKNLKIFCISNEISDAKKYEHLLGIGPQEFVSLFKYSDYICTQSFHGTVLSMLFNRQFFTFDRTRKGEPSGLILRIQSLLNTVGLESRIMINDKNVEDCLKSEDIDFTYSNTIISDQRIKGLDFLRNSIEKAIGLQQE